MTKNKMPVHVHSYLRGNKKFPSVWCPGCGLGTVLGAIIRGVRALGLEKSQVAMVSGIGCSGRMPVYVDFCTLHTTHGRALAFATGLKLARPGMKVIVVMGDGDAIAIGGNHFIHSARRNIDLTAIVVNNRIYGMTGGQASPTTPSGDLATTAPFGNVDQPFDISRLAVDAGASFVARSTVFHVLEMERFIARALSKKGFSMVEIFSQCATYYGRLNKKGSAVDMLKWMKENTTVIKPEDLNQACAVDMAPKKVERGILVERDSPGFLEEYAKIVERAKAR